MHTIEKHKRVAVYGSAGNPITRAHKAFAEILTSSGFFDLVLFLPSGRRPDKPHLIDGIHRAQMADLAFHDEWKRAQPTPFHVDKREVHRDAIPTAHLLRELDREFPEHEHIFTTGVDVLVPKEIYGGKCDVAHYWEEGEELLRRTFAVVPRGGYAHPQVLKEQGHLPSHFLVLPELDENHANISSTEVRRRLLEGLSVDDLLDPAVADYINRNRLYRANA